MATRKPITEARANQLILEVLTNFPELNLVIIKIKFVKGRDYYMATSRRLINYGLNIDTIATTFSESAFKGLIAHELAHILLMRKSFFLPFSDEERICDKIAVARGYGNNLLAFHKEHNKTYEKYTSKEGLTTKEIKELMQ